MRSSRALRRFDRRSVVGAGGANIKFKSNASRQVVFGAVLAGTAHPYCTAANLRTAIFCARDQALDATKRALCARRMTNSELFSAHASAEKCFLLASAPR
jgi:hypothetical protein